MTYTKKNRFLGVFLSFVVTKCTFYCIWNLSPVPFNEACICLEQFYPVNDTRNNTLADQYHALAAQEPNVLFGGRLAEYKYYDMAPVIEKVLNLEI